MFDCREVSSGRVNPYPGSRDYSRAHAVCDWLVVATIVALLGRLLQDNVFFPLNTKLNTASYGELTCLMLALQHVFSSVID